MENDCIALKWSRINAQGTYLSAAVVAVAVAIGLVGCDSGGGHGPSSTGPWTNSLGMVFIPVKGTRANFCIWPTRVKDFGAFANATDYRAESAISTFAWRTHQIAKHPLGSRKNPGFVQAPDHPVVCVNWADADAFCRWLTAKEHDTGVLPKGKRYRLPTYEETKEALAFKIGYVKNGRQGTGPFDLDLEPQEPWPAKSLRETSVNLFPWGNLWPPPPGAGNLADRRFTAEYGQANLEYTSRELQAYDDGFAATSPVGQFQPSSTGLYDMAGNVICWLGERFPQGRDVFGTVVWPNSQYGSAWDSYEVSELPSANIRGAPGETRQDDVGFRCVIGN